MVHRMKQGIVFWMICTASLAMADSDWWRGMQRWINDSGDAVVAQQSQDSVQKHLRRSVMRSFDELGREGAFDRDPDIRLELPPSWQAKRRASLQIEVIIDAWEAALNRAAEQAMPSMREYWLDALQAARFELSNGQWDNASQRFGGQFKAQAESALRQQFVKQSRTVIKAMDLERFPRQLQERFPAERFPEASVEAMARWLSVQGSDAVFAYIEQEELRAQLEMDSRYFSRNESSNEPRGE